MSNKKGFTLVELLAVIVILAVILLIAVPSVSRLISSSRDNAYVLTAKAYIGAARYKYLLEHNHKNVVVYDVKELEVDKKKSPYNKKIIDGAVVVKKDKNSNVKYYIYLVDEDYNSIIDIAAIGGSFPVLINESDLNKSYIKKLNVLTYSEYIFSNYDILGLYYFSDSLKTDDSSKYEDYIMFTKKTKKVVEINNEEDKIKARNYKKGSLIYSPKLKNITNMSYWINLGTTVSDDGKLLLRLFPHYYDSSKKYDHSSDSFGGLRNLMNGYTSSFATYQPLKEIYSEKGLNVEDVSILNIKDFTELDPRLLIQAYSDFDNKSNLNTKTFWILDDDNSNCTFEPNKTVADETLCSTITVDLNDKNGDILKKGEMRADQWNYYKLVLTVELDEVMDAVEVSENDILKENS